MKKPEAAPNSGLQDVTIEQPVAYAATISASNEALLRASTDATILAPASLDEPSHAPESLGERYKFRDKLGAGGMGDVRVFKDRWIGRDVAWKTLNSEAAASGGGRARFLREIRVQGQLEHPSIVPVYDIGMTDEGDYYFTMRRIKGLTLGEVLEGLGGSDETLVKRFSRRKLLTAFSSICMAVHYAHTRGVVHRDLKPGNIMLGEYGEVYVLDWGIAKIVGVDEKLDELVPDEVSTENGRVIGTLGYMSPEQANGRVDGVDARTDVYALGVILFEILTLEHLVKGPNPIQALKQILEGVDARPSTRGADVAPELETICVRATSKEPADRFPSAQALSDAVERYLDGDRDLERRRELASGCLARAERLAAEAGSSTSGTASHDARTEAMREVLHALVLAPEQPDAQRTLGRLLLETPKELPPAAAAERHELRRSERAEGALLGYKAYASYLLAFPLMLLLGVKSWPVIGGGLAITAASALYARWLHKTKKPNGTHFFVLLAFGFLVVEVQGTWLGPFVLMPTAATLTTSLFSLYAEKRERPYVLAAGALMVLLPFAAEILHLVPPGFSFEPGRIVLHERTLALSPTLTMVALIYTAVGFVVLPGLFLAKLRDALSGAEDWVFLQAWTLKQLFPDAARDASDRPAQRR